MKKCLGATLLVAFASASAFAGQVTFSPASQPGEPGNSVQFDLSISADTFTNWDSMSVLVGSDVLNVTDFSFTQTMEDNAAFAPFVTPDSSIYASGQLAGIFLSQGVEDLGLGSDVAIGTVTVEVPMGADPASAPWPVLIDSGRDFDITNIAQGLDTEGLSGAGEVTPEPATLGLLGLGGIAALRRRKKA
ncbi:MAG: PEP-CTERM sorting domain-containing protein [Phycisphaerae bacterium]